MPSTNVADVADLNQTPPDSDIFEARGRLGVVSNPISFSTNVKFVVPINFHIDLSYPGQDVIFVYENHIEWKRINDHGEILHIVGDWEFASSIQAARNLGSNEVMQTKPRPQYLVLTLTSHEIFFVEGRKGKDGQACFFKVSRALPSSSRSLLEVPGNHLSVDATSRAMAIGAPVDTLILCAITSQPVILSAGSDPIERMLVLNTMLIILNVQFVTSASNSEMVHLLVVGIRDGRLRRTIYHWLPSSTVQPDGVERHDAVFDSLSTIPEIVAPLGHEGAVAMLHGETLAVYTGCDSSEGLLALSMNLNVFDMQPSLYLSPPWANHDLLTDQESHTGFNILSIARADGFILLLKVMYDGEDKLVLSEHHYYTRTDCDIDTAFASFQLEEGGPIIFIVGGSGFSAGVFSTEDSMKSLATALDKMKDDCPFALRRTCDFGVQYPCNDACAVHHHCRSYEYIGPSTLPLSRTTGIDLYVTSGKAHEGAISRILYGLRANITMHLGNEEFIGVRTLWAIPRFSNRAGATLEPRHDFRSKTTDNEADFEVFILSLSGFNVSLMLRLEEPVIHEFSESHLCDLATLTSMTFKPMHDNCDGSIVVQVTLEGISLLQVNDTSPFLHHTSFFWPHSNTTTALINPMHGLILCVEDDDQKAILCLRRIFRDIAGNIQLITVGHSVTTSQIITALCFHSLRGQMMFAEQKPGTVICPPLGFALTGSRSGQIQIFSIDEENGLSLMLELHHAIEKVGSPGLACESIAVINLPDIAEGEYRFAVLCGLRNGDMQTFFCEYNSQSAHSPLRQMHHQTKNIGRTPVHVMRESYADDKALLYCGKNVCEVTFPDEEPVPHTRITNVWFLDAAASSYDQSAIYALSQCYSQKRQIACISSSSFLLAKLETCASLSVSRRVLYGTPKKFFYSNILQCFVVAVASGGNESEELSQQYSLCLVRAPQAEVKCDLDEVPTVMASFDGAKPGEQYTRIIEFLFEDGARKFYRIIAASELKQPGNKQTGYLRYFDVSRSLSLRMVKEKLYAAPIYSLTQSETSGLCFCCGAILKYQTFSFDENRFLTRDNYLLPSPAIHLTCEGPFVFVTTVNDSMMIFKIIDQRLRLVKSDENPRAGITHATLDTPGIVMMSDRSNHVVGVWKSQPETAEGETVCFEMALSSPIIKILQLGCQCQVTKNVPGLLHNDVVGLGLDGSLFAFSIVSVSSWRLLKFVQNLYEFDQIERSGSPTHKAHKGHLEPRGNSPKDFQVDGLMLRRLTDQPDAATVLQRLLDKVPLTNRTYSDFATTSDRKKRFKQLADTALFPVDASVLGYRRNNQGIEEDGSVKNVIRYIRCVLEHPI